MTTRIIGTGSCFPQKIVSNEDLSKVVETNDEWISSRTGIKERRISSGEDTSDLAIGAAKAAIENAGINAKEIELIIVATSSADNVFPNVSSMVQAAVGAEHASGYDMSAACSGFLFALNTAHAFIQAGIYQKALVIGADVMSKTIDWSDRGTCVLFGDGAGAVVVQADETGIGELVMFSDGTKGNVLLCEERKVDNFLTEKGEPEMQDPSYGYLKMDGQEVFKFAVKKVPECISEVLKKSNTNIDDIKYFVLHQANIRIIQAVAKRLKADIEKFPVNLEHYGNTSAATIPVILDEMNREGKLTRGDQIVLSGFGAGLSWGATILTW